MYVFELNVTEFFTYFEYILYRYYCSDSVRIGEETMSSNMLYTREMQSFPTESSVSSDHTFAVAKNVKDKDVQKQWNVVASDLICTSFSFISFIL